MKFASLKTKDLDGQLVLVSKDHKTCVEVGDIAKTMQFALDNWSSCKEALEQKYTALNEGKLSNSQPFQPEICAAPLPRSWQWIDGSCFLNHGDLMQKAFHMDPIEGGDVFPLVYQGAGDSFVGCQDNLVAADVEHGIDFEGEFGIITDAVPMGVSAEAAIDNIRLVVMLNDISFRALAPRELKTGFGFVQSKGSTAFAPIAVTPDELKDDWKDCRVCLPLEIHRNDDWFGAPEGSKMHFGFHELVAHIAKTRPLNPGTVIGSGTVSDANPEKGQACLSEVRAKEMISHGAPQSPFLSPGEQITMKTLNADGFSVFGDIKQTVSVEK